jgi:hypothetical protein
MTRQALPGSDGGHHLRHRRGTNAADFSVPGGTGQRCVRRRARLPCAWQFDRLIIRDESKSIKTFERRFGAGPKLMGIVASGV